MRDGKAMYKYIIFDLDGTLTDSGEGIFKSIRYALDRMGYPHPDMPTLYKFIGPPLGDSFMRYCGMDEMQAEEGVRLFRERYVVTGIWENAVIPGVPEMLKALHERGYILAMASSKPEGSCLRIAEKFGFAPYLSKICGSVGDGPDDTKASVLRRAMAALGCEDEKDSVLMVGDRNFDVFGAAECGVKCLGVEFCPYAEEGELLDAGAVGVIKEPMEILDFLENR